MHWISLSATLTWQVLAHNRHVLLRFIPPYGIHTCRSCEHCPPKQEPRTVTRWPRWPSALFSHSSALHSCRRLCTSGNAHLETCEESRGGAYRLSESRDGLFSIVSVMSRIFFGSCTRQYFLKTRLCKAVAQVPSRGPKPQLLLPAKQIVFLRSKDATPSAPAAGLPKTIQPPYGCRIHRVGDDEAGVHAAETFIATTPQQSHPTVEIRCSRHAAAGRTMPSIYATECSQRSSCLLRGSDTSSTARSSLQATVDSRRSQGTASLIQPTLSSGFRERPGSYYYCHYRCYCF